VSILTSAGPDEPRARRTNELAQGRRAVAALHAADQRLDDLFREFGTRWSYVHADGKSRFKLEDLA
jgi:hypothetical protein